MRPLLPFATLLGTAFLLGCQEQASNPVGLEGPLFDKPSAENPNCETPDAKGHCHAGDDEPDPPDPPVGEDPLVTRGRALFRFGTFGGNGRTCETCHRLDNNLALDVAFITDLHTSDPAHNNGSDLLFIAEFDADLPAFDDTDLSAPAFEDPVQMKARGLILENIPGFGNPPVFRAPPSLFNLAFTSPYGYSGNVANLRLFVDGAIEQHFTKTLDRDDEATTPDFRFATEDELDELEAFMLSLLSPADGDFSLPRGSRRRPEVRGRRTFGNVGCASCHVGTVLASTTNFNTGVEAFDKANSASPTPTTDLGTSGAFQTPGLFGLRKAGFFHNNIVGNNTTALTGRTLQFTNLREAVAFYNSTEFFASPEGGRVRQMTDDEIDDITAFLVALSDSTSN